MFYLYNCKVDHHVHIAIIHRERLQYHQKHRAGFIVLLEVAGAHRELGVLRLQLLYHRRYCLRRVLIANEFEGYFRAWVGIVLFDVVARHGNAVRGQKLDVPGQPLHCIQLLKPQNYEIIIIIYQHYYNVIAYIKFKT